MDISKTIKAVILLKVFILCLSQGLCSQVVINELMASDANRGDWIELYNPAENAVDLEGYFLSDDADNPFLWKFPSGTMIAANGYLLVYADRLNKDLHTNFKLAKEGESIYLIDNHGFVIDKIVYSYQLTNISYGRKLNELKVKGYFEIPTPGEANAENIYLGISPSPVFSVKGGFHTGAQTVEISTNNQDALIFYTLDGTEPTIESMPYDGPILLPKTSVVRVKTYTEGLLPGLISTQSYFIDEPINLPVISLVTDPDHLFSDQTGIYVKGTAGIPGYCSTEPFNVNQDWERPVNIEFFEKDGTVGLNQMAGVKIFGGCSRTRYPIKSLALYARKEYENSSFNYQLFPDKSNEEYETFILRTSGDDQPFTMLRDALAQMVVKDVIDMDVQAYRPVVLYINGDYWGIHNMREKINEHYLHDNHDVNPGSVELLKNNPASEANVIHGSADHYNAMITYLHNNDITKASHYNYICSQMDMDEYINYQIIQVFFGGQDWPANNIKFWRSAEKPFDKWRWILYDMDHTFTDPFTNYMEEATEANCKCEWPNPPWSTYLFRRLLVNESFREEFIRRFFLYADSHFSRERIHQIIDQLQEAIAPEIPRHIQRWGGQKVNKWDTPLFTSVSLWQENVQKLHEFTDTRHEMAKKQVMDHFKISGLSGLQASVKPIRQGTIMAGNAAITNSAITTDIYHGGQLELSCNPQPGYILSHWEVTRGPEKDSALIQRGDSWSYLESREEPQDNWLALDYNEENWKTGNGQFGYGAVQKTVIDYGGDPTNKMITTWFRKKFIIENKEAFTRYTIHLLRDDGAKVYLNGHEVIRDNLNRWATGSYARAVRDVRGLEETTYQVFQVNPALFMEGENILAVEIHQVSVASEDMIFDLDLQATYTIPGQTSIYEESSLLLSSYDHTKVTAFMIPDTAQIKDVFINEIIANNTSGFKDEKGEYEDWIELYNGNSIAVDLAGWFLTDALPPRNCWQIPKGNPERSTILPKSYLIIVADGEPSGELLHAGFKLDKEGDQVALLKMAGKDTVVIDYLQMGHQLENVSLGRYPDGSDSVIFMPVSTPMAANFSEPLPPVPAEKVSIYPVPTNGPLFVKFNIQPLQQNVPVKIHIYSLTGRIISNTQHSAAHIIKLSLLNQPKGIYQVRIFAGNEVFDKKIVTY